MDSVNKRLVLLVLIPAILVGCGGMMNDLNPSGTNKQTASQSGTVGYSVGQIAPDFTLPDTLGTTFTLSTALTETGVDGVVLYFTMWCPACDVDMSDMRSSQIPNFPNVRFMAIDYLAATAAEASHSQQENGYAGSDYLVLADTTKVAQTLYNGTMGVTVVIDKAGTIRMNEGYKNDRLSAALTSLP